MSLSIQYESVADAQMRLQNTIVLYDKAPVYITKIGNVGPGDPKPDTFRVYAFPLPYNKKDRVALDPFADEENQKQLRKFISSKKFDLAPFPMGFVNRDGQVYYTSRAPRRQQKQGLSEGTFTVRSLLPGGRPFGFMDAFSSQEFADCVNGKYPSLEEATEMLKQEEIRAVAFCRTFALVKDPELEDLIYLYHKEVKVGFILEDQLKLTKIAQCLKEALREVGVKC
jgi:hypothetical protein